MINEKVTIIILIQCNAIKNEITFIKYTYTTDKVYFS